VAQVGQQHSVHPAVRGEPFVDGLLPVRGGDVHHEPVAPLAEGRLDPRDERREERVGPDVLRFTGEHQPEGSRLAQGQGAGGTARLPAQFGGRGEDALLGLLGDPRTVVQREGDGRA
jgi:hypothetical protein